MDWPDRILLNQRINVSVYTISIRWLTRKLLYVRVDTMSIRVGRGPEGGPRSSRKQIRSMLDDETGRRDEILVCLQSLVSAAFSRSAYSRENSYCWNRRCRATAVTAHVFHAASRFILKRLLKRREAVFLDEVSPYPFSFSPRAWTKGKGYSRETTTVASASMREFVISRDTWPFLFWPTSKVFLLAFPIDRSVYRWQEVDRFSSLTNMNQSLNWKSSFLVWIFRISIMYATLYLICIVIWIIYYHASLYIICACK